MVLYFSNSSTSSTRKDINLLFLSLSPFLTINLLTNTLILGNTKTNGLITLSKYLMKYLELVFVSSNLEITILSTLTSQMFIGIFFHHKFFFCYFCLAKSHYYHIIILSKTFFFHYFLGK